jgi:LacI family transcriptional regulator
MIDVARLAGVSQPTVSFVLNERADARVAPATRRRVLEAARRLNFRPNRKAQELRSKTSHTIGIVTSGIASSPYAGRTVVGIQEAVRDSGYVCLLADTGGDPRIEETAVADLLDHGLAGVVYAPPHTMTVRPTPKLHDITTIFVNCWPPQDFHGQIVIAHEYDGGFAAANAAFKVGHRRVALLGGTPDEWSAIERKRGFVDAARQAGVTGRLLIRDGAFDVDSGYELTRALFKRHHPTALVCGNDRMAVGSLLALHEMSLRVPDDVSLVGYDDQQDLASGLRPRLTTVGLPHFELGYRAGQLMIDPEQPEPTAPIYIKCPLVERDSIAPPRPGTAPDRRRATQTGFQR